MDQGEFPLSDGEFARVKARVYAQAGISLSDAKRTLVVSRLSKLLRARGLRTFDAYLDFLEKAGTAADDQDFVNALTTNLTRFWREDHHFEHLVDHIGQVMGDRLRQAHGGRPRLRLWSAGCSTGQEPYTIALSLLAAYPDLRRWDFRILATDIDTSVLAKAATGVYPETELNGLSAARAALFERPGDGTIRIPLAVRGTVVFKPLNLIGDAWPMRGPFDAIFCRNVAIYFDKPTQRTLFNRLGRMLAPDGFLYIGHSENIGTTEGFRLVGKTIYQARTALSARDAA